MASTQNDSPKSQSSSSTVHGEPDIYEDEIDLRQYFDVIVKRKKLILIVFFVCTVLTAIVSVLSPKTYQATSSIMVLPSKIQTMLSPSRISLDFEKTEQGKYMTETPKPTISISTHKTLLKSNTVLQKLMDRLKPTGTVDEELTIEELLQKLKVKQDAEETNVLQLVAKDRDPDKAKDTVNIWAEEYVKYSLELIGGEVLGSGEFVLEQFKRTEDDLAKADAAVKDFDVKERLSLMQIELKESKSQLELHYTKVHKLDFSLAEKKHLLQRTDENIAAMTKDGVWLGAFSIKALDEKQFVDESLNDTQKALRQKTLKVNLVLEADRQKRDDFVNESGIESLKAEVECRRQDLLADKALLAKVKQLSEATKVNLESKGKLEILKELQGPIAENMSDLTIWEIMSLMEGYNFFETRGQSLAQKVEKLQEELKKLEKALFEYNEQLRILDENLSRAQLNYDFYHEKLKALVKEKNSAGLEIAGLEYELAYSKDLVGKLEATVEALKTAINEKTLRQTELKREFDIATRAYGFLASKIEEARIAKAMELGEVKIVSTAFEPKCPIRPNKKLNVVIAGVVSLMLGVFLAFFREFWQKSEDVKKAQA